MGENFKYLFGRYFDKQASAAERSEFLELLKSSDYDAQLESLMDDYFEDFMPKDNPFSVVAEQRMLKTILQAGTEKRDDKVHKLWRAVPLRWAAAILLILGTALFFYVNKYYVNLKQESYTANDIAPGKNTATLTLSNGKQIILSDAVKGKLAQEAGIEISKAADGQVIYNIAEEKNGSSSSAEIRYNTLTTANGEQYQVRLPDGTNVWLNSASSLTYPASFASAKNRTVKLNGEGYFEVAKDKAHPFIVKTDRQEVEVLGTHFNINSYADEDDTKTTLLEGSVRIAALSSMNSRMEGDMNDRHPESVMPAKAGTGPRNRTAAMLENNSITLKPGQQATLTNQKITVEAVEAEYAIAWKNGFFMFNNENLENVMLKISRWYNVSVQYEDPELKQQNFLGTVSKYEHVSKVLKLLEKTGNVTFQLEGKMIKVLKKK